MAVEQQVHYHSTAWRSSRERPFSNTAIFYTLYALGDPPYSTFCGNVALVTASLNKMNNHTEYTVLQSPVCTHKFIPDSFNSLVGFQHPAVLHDPTGIPFLKIF